MPPKRKRGEGAVVDDEREKFRKRGDLEMYQTGTKADLALTVEGKKILLHQQFLISRVGYFKQRLTGRDELDVDDNGMAAISLATPNAKSVLLVVEFVYGKGMLEIMEYPSEKKPFIQDCILIYNLGHSFDIPDMVKYAINHLGNHLSKKLKDICRYPIRDPAAPREFMDDLEAGIKDAEKADSGKTLHAQRNHPRRMLLDFMVVAGDVLLRDSTFRFNIGQDVLPAAFIRDLILAQTDNKYQTPWMTRLAVRPRALDKAMKNRGRCTGCEGLVAKEQQAVFNPWSHQGLERKYTQFCCEGCAMALHENKDFWDVFDDVKEE